MRKIPLSHGMITFLDELEYSEAGLAADPEAAHLAAPFHDAIAKWESLFKKEREGRRDVTRAEAVVAVRNAGLDGLTTRFAAATRAFAAPLLGKMFRDATPGQFIRQALRVQCEKTRDVILTEIGKLEPGHGLAVFGPQLDASVGAAFSALDVRAKTKGNRQVVANETDEWKEGVNALRTTTYAELLKIAVMNKYPKSWVESFFRAAAADVAEDEADPEVATSPG
ncbi:hypothetical protein [Polyangium fumosum]|uniref:Uncharacterized protein n=1 Tax=Polyangium fumosum TaxID=889272 RepID=A0A4U1JIY6_9BACT|nr:hypothetical protein [Polyangium fumosum]TKD12474.1 hypothetical protein E8A74_05095 [Polyangium fumosum]